MTMELGSERTHEGDKGTRRSYWQKEVTTVVSTQNRPSCLQSPRVYWVTEAWWALAWLSGLTSPSHTCATTKLAQVWDEDANVAPDNSLCMILRLTAVKLCIRLQTREPGYALSVHTATEGHALVSGLDSSHWQYAYMARLQHILSSVMMMHQRTSRLGNMHLCMNRSVSTRLHNSHMVQQHHHWPPTLVSRMSVDLFHFKSCQILEMCKTT